MKKRAYVILAIVALVLVWVYFIFVRQPGFQTRRYMKEKFAVGVTIYENNKAIFDEVAKIVSSKSSEVCITNSPEGPIVAFTHSKKQYEPLAASSVFSEDECKKIQEVLKIQETDEPIDIDKFNGTDVMFGLFSKGGLDFIRLVYLPNETVPYYATQKEMINDDWMVVWASYPRV